MYIVNFVGVKVQMTAPRAFKDLVVFFFCFVSFFIILYSSVESDIFNGIVLWQRGIRVHESVL